MFKKIIGKTCKNPECELKDKLKEDFATMCDCGHALEDVTATDNKKVAIFSSILILLLIGGAYLGIMKLKGMAIDKGKEVIGALPGNLPIKGDVTPQPQPPKGADNPPLPVSDPRAAMTLVSDGLNLIKDNKFQDAIEKFNQATSKDQNNDQAWGNLGAAYVALGQHKEALEPSKKAVALNPKNAIWHLNIAEIYSVTGNKQDALSELELAINNGFTDKGKLKNFNFKAIENEPKFKQLVKKN